MSVRSSSRAALCGLALLLTVSNAAGNSFSVNPVRVTLSEDQLTNSLSVRNNGLEPTTVQLEVLSWSQVDGEDVLEPTGEVLATPPVFTIPAEGSQIIRLGLRRPLDPVRELTYRLLIKELPPPPSEKVEGVRIALHMSLPVFVLPQQPSVPSLAWGARHEGENTIKVSLANDGNIHVKVASLSLARGDGSSLGARQLADYVLAGEDREWPIEVSTPVDGVLQLVAQTDAGEFRTQIQPHTP